MDFLHPNKLDSKGSAGLRIGRAKCKLTSLRSTPQIIRLFLPQSNSQSPTASPFPFLAALRFPYINKPQPSNIKSRCPIDTLTPLPALVPVGRSALPRFSDVGVDEGGDVLSAWRDVVLSETDAGVCDQDTLEENCDELEDEEN